MKSTVIELSSPVAWFDKRVDRVVMKEPSGAQYLDLGEPRFFVRAADGSIYPVEREDVIARYLGQLVMSADGEPVTGGSASLMRVLSLTDAIALKQALLDFFTDAALATSRERSASSSSAPGSSPRTPPIG